MAIVITEYNLTDEQLQYYDDKGYEVFHGYENVKVPRGTAVIFELKHLYKGTMNKINSLLYSNCTHFNNREITYDKTTGEEITVNKINKYPGKHNITLKYGDTIYHLNKLEEWHYTHQSDDDVNRVKSYNHPVLQAYYDQCKEYTEKHKAKIATEQYKIVTEMFDVIPSDHDVDILLDNYAKLYGIYVPQDDKINRLKMYQQIKFYLDNNIEPDYLPDEDVELSIGNSTMLDDFIYKNSLVQD